MTSVQKVTIQTTFSSASLESHLVGFLPIRSFGALRICCKAFSVIPDFRVFQHFTNMIPVRNWARDLAVKDFHRVFGKDHPLKEDYEEFRKLFAARRVEVLTKIAPYLISFSLRTKDDNCVSEQEFLNICSIDANFSRLKTFHYSFPDKNNPRKQPFNDLIERDHIRELARKCPNIETLHITLYYRIRAFVLNVFLQTKSGESSFAELKHLSLECNGQFYTEELIPTLKSLPSLKTIAVEDGQSGPVFNRVFTEVPKLTSLKVNECRPEDISIFSSLQKLNIIGRQFSYEEYGRIFSSLPNLTSLTVGNHSLENRHIGSKAFIELLHKVVNLRELVFSAWRDSYTGVFESCNQMKQLHSIRIRDNDKLSSYVLSDLSNCGIRELELTEAFMGLHPKGMVFLKNKTLETLILGKRFRPNEGWNYTNFPVESIRELVVNCPNLTCLDINHSNKDEIAEELSKPEVVKSLGRRVRVIATQLDE